MTGKGHRNKSIVRGAYAADSLGDSQPEKKHVPQFRANANCKAGRHSWLFGTDCAVCSQCGETVDKTKVIDERTKQKDG
jgi:hypothetical protein